MWRSCPIGNMPSISLSELSEKIGGKLLGKNDLRIRGVSGYDKPLPETILYVNNAKKIQEAEASSAAALLIPASVKECKKPAIAVSNPKLAFAKLLGLFHPAASMAPGIHPTAVIDKTAVIGRRTTIGPQAVVGPRAKIGDRVKIEAFAYLGEGVHVGDDTAIHVRATLLDKVQVGSRCILSEGCVIGSQGFGYATDEKGNHMHIPHVGTVILEDDVEIGANATIDRAVLTVTRIKKGTKIDNQVQVAHNCEIGEHCLIAALSGMSGSVTLGHHTVMGGLTGVREHVHIAERTAIGGGSMIWGETEPGSVVSGEPARPHREQLKTYAAIQKLPELLARLEPSGKARSSKWPKKKS